MTRKMADPRDPRHQAIEDVRITMLTAAFEQHRRLGSYDLSVPQQAEALMIGMATALCGVLISVVKEGHSDTAMAAVIAYLPKAYEQAASTLDAPAGGWVQ